MNSNKYMHKSLVFLMALSGIAALDAARAQQVAAPAAVDAGSGASGGPVLQEVVVTAFKQGAQSVQSIPSSIDVMGSSQLEAMGVSDFADFARSVPGLNFVDSGPGNKRYIIRGINSPGEAQTALYFDNIPFTGVGGAATDFGGTQADLDLYDMQQIDVLRGPQGTLYGANSQAGVIRFVTAKPVLDRYEGSGLIDLSDTEDGGFNHSEKGMVNLPIVSGSLSLRLVGYEDRLSGFIDNPLRHDSNFNDLVQDGGRASLKWQIDGNTSLLAQVFYQHMYSGGAPVERPFGYTIGDNYFPADGSRQYSQFSRTPSDDDVRIYALTGEHDFGWAHLTAAASYFDRSLVQYQDDTVSFRFFGYLQNLGEFPPFTIPAGGVSVSPETSRLFSTETRLNTDFQFPVNGVIGIYDDHRLSDFSTNVFATNPATGFPDAATQIDERNFQDSTRDFAVFGEATWHITSKLSLLAGLRYFDDVRNLNSATVIPFFGLGVPGASPPAQAQNTGTIHKVNFSYQAAQAVLLYAEYSEGFRAGGTNAATVASVPAQYSPDSTRNVELGTKTKWLGGRMTANFDIYDIEIYDMQVAELFDDGAFSGVGNASGKDAQSKGAELDVNAEPINGLFIELGGNYTQAVLTKNLSGTGNAAFDVGALAVAGAPVLNVPKWNASLSTDYNFPLTGDYMASVGGDVEYTGLVKQTSYDLETYANFNVPLPAYTLVNFRAAIRWKDYQAQLYLDNAFDKNAEVNVFNDVDDPYNIVTNRPRTIGVRLSARF
ncbi:MAG: TonB-dependent receptor [Steroidobacteraceae bacterium]